MSSIVFDGITKRFGDAVAVDDLSLEVRDGEFLVLLGPSGCGKTTALRMIAGLDAPSAGSIRIGDRVVDDLEPAERNISMVFQSYALYPHMTVARNIESPMLARKVAAPDGTVRKLTKAERSQRIAEAAAGLGLEDLLDRKPAALSGGQRQRVALARAIVGRPEAFLMDEPLSNLDAKLRVATRAELVRLHERLGTTIVYVTHDQVEAMTMADRVALLDAGRLQQVGTPQEVYDRPANRFVAQFLGSPPMNVLRLDGRPGWTGVRPEHVELAPAGAPGALAAGVVGATEWLGHERHVHVEVAGQPVIVREPVDAPVRAPGGAVALLVVPEHLHGFDDDTGARIT
ncbi:MAG: ABC transporter ATP-binding protein [Acidimicrobiales bacterium]